MLRDIQEGPDSALKRFLLDHRHRYTGDFAIFTAHEKTWRNALVSSLGKGAKEFARLLKGEHKRRDGLSDDEIALSTAERAISQALASDETSSTLWHAAACYAFLRCMYGIDTVDGILSPIKAADWAQNLLDAVSHSHHAEAGCFRNYRRAIVAARAKPPWARLHRRLRRRARKVFSDLRFHTFANLYLRPSPTRLL
jgi:hypothetical protein